MEYSLRLRAYKLLRDVTPRPLHSRWDRLQESPLGKRLAQGVLWSVAGAASSRGLALVATIITARFLGKSVFGEFGVVQSTILMFATFASFGMGLTATKHVAEYRATDPARAGRIIGMSSVVSWLSGAAMGLAMAAFAPWLATHTLAAPHLTGALRIAAICLFFNVVSEAQIGALSGFEAFRRRSMIQFIASLANFPLLVAGVYWWGLTGAIWGLTISQALLVFFNFIGLRKEAYANGVPINWTLSRQEFQVLWGFSLPTLMGAVVYVPAMWLANTIMVNTPNGYAEMGVFSAADRWRTAIRFLPTLLGGVALPMLASLQGISDQERYYRVLWTNVKLSFGVSLAAATPIALLASWIMACYGHGFSEGKWVLVNLSVVSVITATSWIVGQALVSEGSMWIMLFLNLIWAVLLLGFCWLLRAKGAQGLALAYLAAEGVRLVLMMFVIRRSRTKQPLLIPKNEGDARPI